MEEIVRELQKISEILLQNQTPVWLTYLSSLGPLILTGISVFIACRQHKQNHRLQTEIPLICFGKMFWRYIMLTSMA